MNVLDIGCGFGNNLLPFLSMGCKRCGTEVTQEMATQTLDILQDRGYAADIRAGRSTAITFEEDSFDLVLSVNVIHYEKTYEDIVSAFHEYNRVL